MLLSLRLYSLTLSYIVLIFATTASSKNIWRVSIWEAPAPPPGKGPPIADSALRDESYLPAQISAIVAAYVFSLLVIGSAILFVGRRLRRAAQASPKSLAMEMLKPVKTNLFKSFDPSPVSPATTHKSPGGLYGPSPAETLDMKNNWPSPNKLGRNSPWGSISKGHRKQPSVHSVAASSVVTFDESVIEDDRERNQKEMERLYAAVMEHDDKKSTSVLNAADQEQQQNPPELQHLRLGQHSSALPASSESNAPSRTSTKSPRASSKPTPLSLHSRNSSRSSFGSFGKKRGVRSLSISAPMGSPDLVPDHHSTYGESEPLSPRVYDDPGPPPPTPPHHNAMKSRQDRLSHSRLSPQDAKFPPIAFRGPRSSVPPSPTVQTIPEITNQYTFQKEDCDPPMMTRDYTKAKRAPAPLSLSTRGNASSGSQRQTKPLQIASLPLRNPHPTTYNADRTSTIKATVLERKAPNSALRTPGTGVPMTPYSPYMPYTPLTPMTPSRLVTREERKRREKEEGRRVATIDDAVEEEPDMWGDAYS